MTTKNKLEYIICPICKFTTKYISMFEQHIIEQHHITPQEFYLQTIKDSTNKCQCGCGQTTTWLNYKRGFQKFICGHNASIYTSYDKESANRLALTRGSNWRGKPHKSKGKTKETDEWVANRGKATSIGRKKAFDEGKITIWHKGLTKETDERVAQFASDLKEGYALGDYVPWAKGLTKETSEVVANMAMNVSITHNKKEIRDHLDSLKRLSENEIKQRIEDTNFFTLLGGTENYETNTSKVLLVKCNKCGEEFTNSLVNIVNGKCFNCSPGGSKGQEEVALFVESLGFEINRNDRHTLINKQELDIYVPSRKFAIEYNGLYWHCVLNKPTLYHHLKSTCCINQNISLFHIYEDEWRDKQDIVKSMIMHKLGVTPNKIYACKTTVKQLTNNERKTFFSKNHIEDDSWCTHAFGLIYNNEIISAISAREKDKTIEIIKFCCKLQTQIPGAFSKLLNQIKLLAQENNIHTIKSIFDSRLGISYVYEQNKFIKNTIKSPTFQWTNCNIRFPKSKYRANTQLNLSETQVANQNGVVKIWGCNRIEYVLHV